jgi:hypothetical protein
MNRRSILVCALAVVLGASIPSAGQIIPAIPVFDVGNKLVFAEELVQAIKQVQQLVTTYNFLVAQAKMIPHKLEAFGASLIPWRATTATNTYGLTGGWIQAVNTGGGVIPGYQLATERMQTYGQAMANVPLILQPRVMRRYSLVELADGTSQNALATIGQYRAEEAARRRAISNLVAAATSDNAANNTQIAVLNAIANGQALSLQNSQAANALDAAILEQLTLAQTRERELRAIAIDNDIEFRSLVADNLNRFNAHSTEALHNLRIP